MSREASGNRLPITHPPSWPMYHLVWRRAELLDRMIGALHLDMLGAVTLDSGQGYFDARTTCLACIRAAECARMLDSNPQPAGPPDFCPNIRYFGRCPRRRTESR